LGQNAKITQKWVYRPLLKGNVSDRFGDLNIWEVMSLIRNQWRWPLFGGLIGLVAGFALYMVLPSKYEATVVISPARVGSLTVATSGATIVQGSEPEPAALMIERFKQPSFYSASIREKCQFKESLNYQAEMVKDLNANMVKLPNPTFQSLSLAKLSWNASSPQIASDCLSAIVFAVKEAQNLIAAPVIAKLTAQKKITQDQVNLYLSELAKYEAKAGNKDSANNFNQIVIADKAAQNLRESLTVARKQLAEEEAQLSEPYTQAVKQLEPIYAAFEPIITTRLAIILGLLAGIFIGSFALLLKLSLLRYQSKAKDGVDSK
jgi:hypothetical protein